MKPGDVVLTSHIRQILDITPGGKIVRSADWSAGKKDNFVFIFLGIEPKDGSANLDPIQRLKDLGWELKEGD